MEFATLLASLAIANRGRWGIGTAKQYLGALEPCVGGECLVRSLGNLDAGQWVKELAESESRLTYCDPAFGDPTEMTKSIREGADIASGSVLEFDAVLTTRSKDRDGDILETKGLNNDPNHPLLWMHLQMQPIGKFVKSVYHDEGRFIPRYAIADTALGRDAATLVKFGALRMSIGFRPREFAPLQVVKGADGKDVVRGWHIKQFDAIEGSVVSVPANSDAVVLATYEKNFGGVATAFSRDALKHEAMRAWAKSIFDLRPLVLGIETKAASETTPPAGQAGCGGACACGGKKGLTATDAALLNDLDPSKKCDKHECKACGETYSLDEKSLANGVVAKAAKTGEKPGYKCDSHACKSCGMTWTDKKDKTADAEISVKRIAPDELATKLMGVDDELEGSFEWTSRKLQDSAMGYLVASGKLGDPSNCWASIAATYLDRALVTCVSYGSKTKYAHYLIAYETVDGSPKWTGEPQEVDVKTQVITKQLAAESPAGVARKLAAIAMTLPHRSGEAVDVQKHVSAIRDVFEAEASIEVTRQMAGVFG